MLSKDNWAGMASLFPRTTFLHVKGAYENFHVPFESKEIVFHALYININIIP